MLFRYTGHKNESYKIDSCVTSSDTYILTGSEDGKVYMYDLVEVTSILHSFLMKKNNYNLLNGMVYSF